MGAERYEVVLVDSKSRRKEKRRWRPEEIVRSLSWLKRMNARGFDVLIAPSDSDGLILIDGLQVNELKTLEENGLNPAAVIQSSPEQYQAWIKISGLPVTAEVRQRARQALTRSLRQLDSRGHLNEFGRLAGFTCYGSDKDLGKQRCYVVIRSLDGVIGKGATALLKVSQTSQAAPSSSDATPLGKVHKVVKKYKRASL